MTLEMISTVLTSRTFTSCEMSRRHTFSHGQGAGMASSRAAKAGSEVADEVERQKSWFIMAFILLRNKKQHDQPPQHMKCGGAENKLKPR